MTTRDKNFAVSQQCRGVRFSRRRHAACCGKRISGGVIQFSGGKKRPPDPCSAGEKNLSVAKKHCHVTAASRDHSARRRKSARRRVIQLSTRQITSVVAACNQNLPVGKQRRGMTGSGSLQVACGCKRTRRWTKNFRARKTVFVTGK